MEVYDGENNLVASYTYDAWGNCTFGANVDNIANVNPFRYRGYYYDWETRYYYLQTRYYDAEVGRFLNADDVKYLNPKRILGCNLYCYCLNNPIALVDSMGSMPFKSTFWLERLESRFSSAEEIAEIFDPVINSIDLFFEWLKGDNLTEEQIKLIAKQTGRSPDGIRNSHNAATLKTSKMGKTISKTANFIAVVALVADVGSCIVEHIENSENNENVVVDCAVDVLEIVTIHAVGYAVAYAFSLLGPLGMIVGGLLSYGLTTALKAACE